MRYKIYSKDSKVIKAEVEKLEYSGVFLGERYVSVTINNACPIEFAPGDFIEYRGEKFVLPYVNSEKRQSRSYSNGNSIVYEDLRFYGTTKELENTQMCDYVPSDNNLPYSARGEFSFYVSSVKDFGQRVQANLDETYGKGVWVVAYGDNAEIDKGETMSIGSGTSIYSAISQFYEQFKVNATVRDRVITFGATMGKTGHTYIYGKGNGLKSLGRTIDSSQKILTKLKSYGSTRNLPYDYYNKVNGKVECDILSVMKGERNGHKCYGIYVSLPKIYISDEATFELPENKGQFTGTWRKSEDSDIQIEEMCMLSSFSKECVSITKDNVLSVIGMGATTNLNNILEAGRYRVSISSLTYNASITEGKNNVAIICTAQIWDLGVYMNYINGRGGTFAAQIGYSKQSPGAGTKTVHINMEDTSVQIDASVSSPVIVATMEITGDHKAAASSIRTESGPIYLNRGELYSNFFIHECDTDTDNEKYLEIYNYLYESLTSNNKVKIPVEVISGANKSSVPPEFIFVANSGQYGFYTPNLMLPGFPLESLKSWADRVAKEDNETGRKVAGLIEEGWFFSDNPTRPYIITPYYGQYGLSDGEKIFDGSDEEWEEVYASIEGLKTSDLYGISGYAGSITYNDEGYVDKIIGGSSVEDNGVSSNGVYDAGSKDTEGTLMSTSTSIIIPNIGFNIWNYRSSGGDTPTIHFESGMCGGRSFEILSCVSVDSEDITKGYKLKIQRTLDQAINMYYPNKAFNISAGDAFVLEGIVMPDIYVSANSVKLFFETIDYLRENDKPINEYQPEIDNIFIARHPEYAEELVEGVYFVFEDKELGIDNIGITIQQLTIREEDGNIAQYEISLNNDKEENLLNAINKSISKAGEAIKKESKTEIDNFTRDVVTRGSLNEDLNGYATKEWVMSLGFINKYQVPDIGTKVDTDFFSRVFDVMGTNDKPIEVNDSESEIKSVKVKYGLWSEAFLSALGLNGEGSSGGGSFDLLQDWDKYVDETAKSMALSAYLGKDLLDRVVSLESGQKGHKITISGSGNVVVDVGESNDGSTLTFTKGNIDLSGYATTTALAEVSNKADAVTEKVNDFLEGTDTDNIINRWKELEAFLAGQTQTSTLSELLAVKANKSVRVNAGEGLAGGGSLSLDVTLSLATVGTEGTYTKVTVDKYGRVTGHASLTATDIPVLDISKINGLQGELDKKLNITDFGSKFAAEMANWFKKDTDGNVLVANAKGFYSESFVSALGKSSGGSSSGGSSFDLLQDWNKYDDSTAKNTALSAYLGKSLLDRMVLDFSDIDNCRINGTGKSGVFDVYYNGHSVGTLLVSNDFMSHGTNQLFITNMLMDVNFNSHQDDRIYVYYRYYNFMAPNAETAKGTWSKWCLVIGSKAGEDGIARIKGIRDNDIDGVQNAIGVWAIDGTAYNAASETDIINIFN